MKSGDTDALENLLALAQNRAGSRLVLTKNENNVFTHRIRYTAERRFSLDVVELRRTMISIASDGRDGFRTSTDELSNDAIRAWKARNRLPVQSCRK